MKLHDTNPKQRQVRGRAGFTLVELLVVVAIMFLMLKLTLPSLKGLMGGKAHTMARTQLIGDLNRARNNALRNGDAVYVAFMPVYTEVGRVSGDVNAYLKGEGNFMLGEQSVSYAIYQEYKGQKLLRRWLTDWKRLPQGFYFSTPDLGRIRDSAGEASTRLTFSNLKNGHSRGLSGGNGVVVEREISLPYLMYNARGELSSSDNTDGMDRRDFYFPISEGVVLPPELKADGTYSDENATQIVTSITAKKRSVWLQINGLTGRADVLEEAPDKTRLYQVRILTHSISDAELKVKSIALGELVSRIGGVYITTRSVAPSGTWAMQYPSGKSFLWGGYNAAGKKIYNPPRIKLQEHTGYWKALKDADGDSKRRPVVVENIKRPALIKLISRIRRDPNFSTIKVVYQRMPEE